MASVGKRGATLREAVVVFIPTPCWNSFQKQSAAAAVVVSAAALLFQFVRVHKPGVFRFPPVIQVQETSAAGPHSSGRVGSGFELLLSQLNPGGQVPGGAARFVDLPFLH